MGTPCTLKARFHEMCHVKKESSWKTQRHILLFSRGACVYGTGSKASNEFSELDDELVTLQAVFLIISKSDIRRTRFGSPAHPSLQPPVMQFQWSQVRATNGKPCAWGEGGHGGSAAWVQRSSTTAIQNRSSGSVSCAQTGHRNEDTGFCHNLLE